MKAPSDEVTTSSTWPFGDRTFPSNTLDLVQNLSFPVSKVAAFSAETGEKLPRVVTMFERKCKELYVLLVIE